MKGGVENFIQEGTQEVKAVVSGGFKAYFYFVYIRAVRGKDGKRKRMAKLISITVKDRAVMLILSYTIPT